MTLLSLSLHALVATTPISLPLDPVLSISNLFTLAESSWFCFFINWINWHDKNLMNFQFIARDIPINLMIMGVQTPTNSNTSPLVWCTFHMFLIKIHWHVKLNYKEYWRVKILSQTSITWWITVFGILLLNIQTSTA